MSVRRSDPYGPRVVTPLLTEWEMTLLRSVGRDLPAGQQLGEAYRRVCRRWSGARDLPRFSAMCLLLADLYDQGWTVEFADTSLILRPLDVRATSERSAEEIKAKLRDVLRIGQRRQLCEPSVQSFLRSLEEGSAHRESVRSLVDDGEALVSELDDAPKTPEGMRGVIDPYIEFCDAKTRCPITNIPTLDIWRYFRHSWSLEYRPVPGRSLPFLVRNRARPNHPIMGIAMLASPVMKLKHRDAWLELSLDTFERSVASEPETAGKRLREVRRLLDQAISDIRWDDLLSDEEVTNPTQTVILQLQRKASGAAARQESLLRTAVETGSIIRGVDGEAHETIDWVKASEDPLFVKKRAETLAKLLSARATLKKIRSGEAFLVGLLDAKVRRAVEIAMQEKLKSIISTQVMDVSVCGGVAPYSSLTAGKLVALLATSREVIAEVQRRYGNQISLISSQMAGRPIVKTSRLSALTTTSLYGVGSSQYNRLRLRANDHPELLIDLRWVELAMTEGFGSVHLSSETLQALRRVSTDEHGARRINSRFGEGTSPRMRQTREGLEVLGIMSSDVLEHATPRRLYGCRVPPGPLKDIPSVAAIAAAWCRRWALRRAQSPAVRQTMKHQGWSSLQDVLHREGEGQLRLPLETLRA